ncbi:MAG TPA: diaminopimelate epimerase [Flavobacteriales bacterium]|nr:diaminopimelate epimerase [Flavobacteriales bacterium]HIN39819.1 diaminopimelate epimerase [Flavobacteriales bacterium]
MKVHFDKYQGTGNDFIIIDNRALEFPKGDSVMISNLCNRNFGIGADGLILLENDEAADFRMVHFNSDGNQSSMCGNGGRCIVHYAQKQNIINSKAEFTAIDGVHTATIAGNDVRLSMNDVANIELSKENAYMNTGSPHYLLWYSDLDNLNIIERAREIRYNKQFSEIGTNVNFLNYKNGIIEMRTYERGVEAETLSCGTGMVAAALFAFLSEKIPDGNECLIRTKGGETKVSFNPIGNGAFSDICLSGPADLVFNGEINV